MNPFLGQKPRPSYGKKKITLEDKFNAIREQADIVFARWVKERATNSRGLVVCYTCLDEVRFAEADCSHYNDRDNMATRFSEIGCQAGCQKCNRELGGNKEIYRENLIRDYGLEAVEELEALGRLDIKIFRHELIEIITKYSK